MACSEAKENEKDPVDSRGGRRGRREHDIDGGQRDGQHSLFNNTPSVYCFHGPRHHGDELLAGGVRERCGREHELPISTTDLGKPVPDANRDITVDEMSFFNALSPGSYLVTVSAMALGGSARSTPVSFTR
jgi:hypothetical protein